MIERTVSTNGDPRARPDTPGSIGAFVMAHKRVSLGLLGVIVVFVAIVLPAVVGSGRLSDSSPCSSWSSADHSRQTAYARLYVREHGPLPSGATSPESVAAAITAGCAAASINDEADTVSVIQAIDGRY